MSNDQKWLGIFACPVCGQRPDIHGSRVVPGNEALSCNFRDGCPEGMEFDFSTEYLPFEDAVATWNDAVMNHINRNAE